MTAKYITVRASVRLLTIEEGGRFNPVPGPGSYRPNHNFFSAGNNEMTIGFIELPDEQGLRLGEARELVISFWPWERLDGEIYPGREWVLQEGSKVVGHGRVLEVMG